MSGILIAKYSKLLEPVANALQSKKEQPMLIIFPRNQDNRSFNSNYYRLYNWIEYS